MSISDSSHYRNSIQSASYQSPLDVIRIRIAFIAMLDGITQLLLVVNQPGKNFNAA
jgi:hypothetical protein